MTVENYEKLLLKVAPELYSASTREDVITPSEKLMVSIRYLATGESIHSLSTQFRMGVSIIDTFIPKVLKVLWEKLQPKVLKMPETVDGWQKIIKDFEERWQMPHCWGALDGKHVVMTAQPHSGSEYFNYRHAHSIILLAVCDANYKYAIVDVGGKGRQSDGGVLRHSIFGQKFFARSLNLPQPSELFPVSPSVHHFCVADESFSLDLNIMRPFPGRSAGRLPNDQKIFNYRLSRARRIIENAFGLMSVKWRIFRVPINAHCEPIKLITMGSVCLHNFIIEEELQIPEDMQQYFPPKSVDRIANEFEVEDDRMDAFQPLPHIREENLSAVRVRDILKDYFRN